MGSQLLSQQEPDFVYQVIQGIPHLYMGYWSLTKWDALQKFIMGLLIPRYRFLFCPAKFLEKSLCWRCWDWCWGMLVYHGIMGLITLNGSSRFLVVSTCEKQTSPMKINKPFFWTRKDTIITNLKGFQRCSCIWYREKERNWRGWCGNAQYVYIIVSNRTLVK